MRGGVRGGVRGQARVEYEKHGEGFGYAKGRNKGESGGGFALGVRRFNRWGEFSRRNKNVHLWSREETCTIFVDNLPMGVTKRSLYKEFSKDSYIADIFISNKTRRNAKDPFAFIRFKSYGGTMKSVSRMNGAKWEGSNLFVVISKFDREQRMNLNSHSTTNGKAKTLGLVKKWVEVKKVNNVDRRAPMVTNQMTQNASKKMIDGVWAEDQKERLERSLLGYCVKPIEFRRVMNRILDEWKGQGDIEYRDVGPYRCLLTFSSPEIRDEAFHDPLLLSVFDELKPHWGIFEVFVKEVGAEVYSIEAHPNLEKFGKASVEESTSCSHVDETPTGGGRLPVDLVRQNLNLVNVADPQLSAIINDNCLEIAPSFIGHGVGCMGENGCGYWTANLMVTEAHLQQCGQQRVMDTEGGWSRDVILGKEGPTDHGSIPDSGRANSNWELAKVASGCDGGSTEVLGVSEFEQTINTRVVLSIASTEVRNEGESISESLSDDTQYVINECMLLKWRKETDVAVGLNRDLDGVTEEDEIGLEIRDDPIPIGGEANAVGQVPCPDSTSNDATRFKEALVVSENHVEEPVMSDDISDDDSLREATESKGLWKRSGLLFDNSDDDEVLVRLFNCDPDNVKRATKKAKKQKQGRKPPNIQGRSLETRKLRSGTKLKLR
ncbi:hypothetical protein PIB30_071906 [Stylosanthes scabra]|uniref:RRM domain-containing protein n=1 Tax=Stylosanthes scabra TaxID=79078 RepID=A0ABU6RPT1_9FABA|nr:hypothetical protein [Stylosanthes scabra]